MTQREIKFRAWDIPNKRMCLVKDIHFRFDYREDIDGPVSGIMIQTEDGDDITLNYELMQYVGLKDKNGKEIYEGDILRGGRVVVYGEIDGGYESEYGIGFNINPYWPSEEEVVGNVWENPELLENK